MNFTDLAQSILRACHLSGLSLVRHNNGRIRQYTSALTRMGLRPWTLKMVRCTHHLKVMKKHLSVYAQGQPPVVEPQATGMMFYPPGRPLGQKFHLWRVGVHLENPYVVGCPGWHNECATLVARLAGPRKHLVHYGGKDLQPLHHRGEAQLLKFLRRDLRITWYHTNALHVDHVKMSKSLGNTYYPSSSPDLSPLARELSRGGMDRTMTLNYQQLLTPTVGRVPVCKFYRRDRQIHRWFLTRVRVKSRGNYREADRLRSLLATRGYLVTDHKRTSTLYRLIQRPSTIETTEPEMVSATPGRGPDPIS